MTELVVLPPLKAQLGSQGGYVLTRKYMEGVAEFAKTWPGPVTSLVEIAQTPTTDMDLEEFTPHDPTTPIETRPETMAGLEARLSVAALAVTFLSSFEEPLVALCQKIGVPLVFWAEYSPQTEAQILRAETTNPVRRWRTEAWLKKATRVRRQMVAQAAGLQCSGQPVYDAYGDLSRDPMVFWDNRVRSAEVLQDAGLAERTAVLLAGAPLRLAYGGRLIKMKGVQFLPDFAEKLRQNGVPFTLDIYGAGPLETELKQQIATLELGDHVAFKGALNFRDEWLPTLKTKVDLFICPHPQGDPSSTYPETMSCGLPTLGFANEAFAAISAASGCGWTVPISDVDALARRAADLHHNRDEIAAHGRRGRDFAQDHSFEKTMQRRVAHFLRTSRSGSGRSHGKLS